MKLSNLYLALLFFSCSGSIAPFEDADIINCTGTIIYVADLQDQAIYYIQSDITYQGTDKLYPTNLPGSYKIDGLRVVFSGRLIECPPDASCIAQQIKLSAIKRQ
jgi:hypothetical protein